MERDVRSILAGHPRSETLLTALVELWHRTLYQSDERLGDLALQPYLVYQGGGTLVSCPPRIRAFK
jgi:hypothetical protein